ncbi:uncharacterized protein PHACADRAFT_250674 [Phanerochaete carnosa HHB-10118-sp]|uniref:Uncharacterized protein n=1 Tax=Phanerochaete carnosa (strain HHB-10118-sp) TaxID=650164 RepID=K5VAL0_PHACS|nr:uncharacterized protein PHACADRAFT_250674 [Phanerochaete carnosa HHB-10118-sp]EKM59891.1 hypothetical protein PHACADRAFT_250674 [Phanerochaete carnosa HHB-10118-sp]
MDVCVMVSPNRQGHIVAMYGKYRNITPSHYPTSTSRANQTHRSARLSPDEREQNRQDSVL